MPKRRKLPSTPNPFVLRTPPELLARIEKAAAALGIPKAEVVRVCVGLGLRRLELINYDIEGVIVRAAEEPTPDITEMPIAAEDAPPYKAKPKEKPKPGHDEPPKHAAG